VALNVFPVRVTDPDGVVHSTCRLVDDGHAVALWVWPHRAPAAHRIVQANVELTIIAEGRWELRALSGTYVIDKQQGCACGHPLKFWSPRPHAVAAR
jgi:hypothetical protein